MLLCEPEATQWDLRFRLFGVDVRVHPFFWLMSVILGWDLIRHPMLPGNGMTELGLWILATFVSILLHEFGHIWMGQAFGAHGYIVLQGMGGLAVGAGNVATRVQRVLVSAAGPGIQLVLFALLVGLIVGGLLPFPIEFPGSTIWHILTWVRPIESPEQIFRLLDPTPLSVFLHLMLYINLFWPLLNLLPIWPLDGGQITREVFEAASPGNGTVRALWLSLLLAAVISVNAFISDPGQGRRGFLPEWVPSGWWVGLLFASLAFGAWQGIQIEQSRRARYYEESDERMPWER